MKVTKWKTKMAQDDFRDKEKERENERRGAKEGNNGGCGGNVVGREGGWRWKEGVNNNSLICY